MNPKAPGSPQITPDEPEHHGSRRDPEERATAQHEIKEKSLDKTLADSFPTSDPPSTIPDPDGTASESHTLSDLVGNDQLGLPAGTWAALSVEDHKVVGTGTTQEEAIENARKSGHANIALVQIADNPEAPAQSKDAA
jgi:hypothetical protein